MQHIIMLTLLVFVMPLLGSEKKATTETASSASITEDPTFALAGKKVDSKSHVVLKVLSDTEQTFEYGEIAAFPSISTANKYYYCVVISQIPHGIKAYHTQISNCPVKGRHYVAPDKLHKITPTTILKRISPSKTIKTEN